VIEFWTYRPSDFLMFSARSWARLLDAWNGALWPWQWALAAAALGLVALAAARPHHSHRAIALLLAAAWAWIAWAFHWERFADINSGARWFAAAFALQAGLLAVLGTRAAGTPPAPALRHTGLALAVIAVVLYPLAAPATGRGWAQAEFALAMPDPTALFTVGLLLATPQRHRRWLLAIPLLALAAGWTTAWLLWAK
jgi:hypothetical protein